MAKTKGKPGPKTRHESTVDFHIKLPDKVEEGNTMSLADAFKLAAQEYAEEQSQLGNTVYGNGIIALAEEMARSFPRVEKFLRTGQ